MFPGNWPPSVKTISWGGGRRRSQQRDFRQWLYEAVFTSNDSTGKTDRTTAFLTAKLVELKNKQEGQTSINSEVKQK